MKVGNIHSPAGAPAKPTLRVAKPKVSASKRNLIHTPAHVPARKV